MAVVKWEKEGTVAVITMINAENRMNLMFVEEMNQVFDEITEDKSVKAVVITSNDEKYFSLGVHVDWIIERLKENDTSSVRNFLFGMSDVFKRCLLMPVPVIAAINGHAFGNGAIMPCACDYRFMRSDRGFFCLPEVDINIPFLPAMLIWLQRVIPHSLFQSMAFTGRKVTALELEKHNVIVKACKDNEELINESMSFAASFNKGRAIVGEIKKRMNKNIIHVMDTEDMPILDSMTLRIEEE